MMNDPSGRALITVCFIVFAFASDASAQMFGSRQFGGTLAPRQRPGIGRDVGSVRNQRFLRANRQLGSFVGRSRVTQFVGSQQANTTGSASTAVAGLATNGAPANVNQPYQSGGTNRPYDPKLRIEFDYVSPDPVDTAAEVQTRLASISNSIEVLVEGRTAILRGVVADEQQRQLAETLTSFEPAISAVRNDLRVGVGLEVPPTLPPPSQTERPRD